MSGSFLLGIMFGFMLFGMFTFDGDSVPPTPAQYEQAKLDCRQFGGLEAVSIGTRLFSANRVYAKCKDATVTKEIQK